MPMISVTWTLKRIGRDVTVLSYVYAAYKGGREPFRGNVPIEGLKHFPSHLDAPSLRENLLGLIEPQMRVFIEVLNRYLHEGGQALTRNQSL